MSAFTPHEAGYFEENAMDVNTILPRSSRQQLRCWRFAIAWARSHRNVIAGPHGWVFDKF